MPPQPWDQPEGHQTIKDWFASGQRVSCRVYQSLLDSEGRPEFVSCHLIEDLVKSNTSESGAPLASQPSINGSTKEQEGGGRDAVNQMECVTFVHGYPTCSYDYYPVVKHILKGRRLRCKLLLLDMLGYGDSDKGVGQARFSVQQHANVLQCIWDRYDIKSSHLVVHDFAVSVAQELLYRQPKSRLSIDLGKIFWLNGSVFIDLYRPTSLQKMLCAPTGWLTAQLMSQATLAESVKQEFSKEHPPSKQVLADIYTALCNRDGQKVHHKLVRFMKDRRRYKYVWQGALELAMRQDPQRMMFYWGMQDPLSGAHVAAELRRRYSKYSVNMVERKDLGHWPHLEDPEAVADALVDFLLDPDYQPKYVKHAPADESDSIYRVSISFGQMHTYGYCPSSFRRKSSMERSQSGTRAIAVTGDEGGSVRHTPNRPSLPDLSAIEEASQTVEASHTVDTPKGEAKSEEGVDGKGSETEGTGGVAATVKA